MQEDTIFPKLHCYDMQLSFFFIFLSNQALILSIRMWRVLVSINIDLEDFLTADFLTQFWISESLCLYRVQYIYTNKSCSIVQYNFEMIITTKWYKNTVYDIPYFIAKWLLLSLNFFLRLNFPNSIVWKNNIYTLISIHRTSDKIWLV